MFPSTMTARSRTGTSILIWSLSSSGGISSATWRILAIWQWHIGYLRQVRCIKLRRIHRLINIHWCTIRLLHLLINFACVSDVARSGANGAAKRGPATVGARLSRLLSRRQLWQLNLWQLDGDVNIGQVWRIRAWVWQRA